MEKAKRRGNRKTDDDTNRKRSDKPVTYTRGVKVKDMTNIRR